jgi:hypothetical protein
MQVGKHIQRGSGWGCACVDVADSESRRIACFMRGLNQRLTRINRQALMSADGTSQTLTRRGSMSGSGPFSDINEGCNGSMPSNRVCGRPRSQGSVPNVPLVTW